MSKVVVIGAGPAGIMAAITAKENGNEVYIVEKNKEIGKKLNITGKGRCNITYVGSNEDFLNNVVTNSKFLMSSINSFNNANLLELLEKLDIKTKEERGNRVFLASDNARELSEKLYIYMKKLGVRIFTNQQVKSIEVENGWLTSVMMQNNVIDCDKVIIATGGKSYPATGSTGDGYILAKKLGHSIEEAKPALVPVKVKETEICKKLQGLTLKNVSIKVLDKTKSGNKQIVYTGFGETLFTHFGLTGPTILSASSKINKIKDFDEKSKKGEISLIIDLKPALSDEELYKRVTRDFDKYINKEYRNSLNDLLPKSLIPVVIYLSGIEECKKVHQISKEEKSNIVRLLKNLEFTIEDLMSVEAGIITSGGIDVKEINPKTMESKIIKGLYFAGEIIDVDAYTGGYNLQIAFSTGFVAGNNI